MNMLNSKPRYEAFTASLIQNEYELGRFRQKPDTGNNAVPDLGYGHCLGELMGYKICLAPFSRLQHNARTKTGNDSVKFWLHSGDVIDDTICSIKRSGYSTLTVAMLQ